MKRIFATFSGLLLVLSLAACGNSGNNQQPEDTATTVNSQHTSFRSAGRSGPTEQASAESSESSGSVGGRESIDAISVENDISHRLIQITTRDSNEIVFQLNESPAATSFYNQLPLSIWVEDYAGSEKIFYSPEKLETDDTPLAQGPAGTLAYYAPWGNVAVFYGECGGASGLYELGEAVVGVQFIGAMTGEVQIEPVAALPSSPEPAQAENTSSQQAQLPARPSLETPVPQELTGEINFEENTAMRMNVQIGDSAFTATLEENAAVDSFVELMKTAPVVIQMSDYAGFEKVGSLGTSLPASDSQTTTQAGDIVLYNGNQIVIFYGSNSWGYTRLGKIDDLAGWEEALGNGDVTVTFSVE